MEKPCALQGPRKTLGVSHRPWKTFSYLYCAFLSSISLSLSLPLSPPNQKRIQITCRAVQLFVLTGPIPRICTALIPGPTEALFQRSYTDLPDPSDASERFHVSLGIGASSSFGSFTVPWSKTSIWSASAVPVRDKQERQNVTVELEN